MSNNQSKYYQRNRFSYIIEAAVEYFISLLITDTFISNLLLENGVTAAHTGIIIQLASFAFVAQLVSVFYKRRSGMKLWVTLMHLANQLLFAFLYMVPGVNLPQSLKISLIVIMFLGGHIISNVVLPYKISWLMSFVDDKSRGKFTANKEIVSLIGGTVFQLVMANRVDYYMDLKNYNVAFTMCAVTILVMALIHFMCLVSVKDDNTGAVGEKADTGTNGGVFDTLKQIAVNKNFLKVIAAVIIWHIVTGMSVSFYGSYKLKTLEFSILGATVLASISALTRALVSRKFGKYADKNSWAKMLYICFIIVSIAFFANIFVIKGDVNIDLGTLSLGSVINLPMCFTIDLDKIMFIFYSIVHGVAMAGINSGIMNILFDYVPHTQRSAALGISSSVGGIVSFFTALIGGWILSSIQRGDDKAVLGLNIFGVKFGMYGQQVLSLISFAVCVILIVYMKTVILKNQNNYF